MANDVIITKTLTFTLILTKENAVKVILMHTLIHYI